MLLLTRRVAVTCSAAFLVKLTFASLDVVIPLFCSLQGVPPESIGVILSSYFATFVASQIPIGMVSERFNRKSMIITCALASAV